MNSIIIGDQDSVVYKGEVIKRARKNCFAKLRVPNRLKFVSLLVLILFDRWRECFSNIFRLVFSVEFILGSAMRYKTELMWNCLSLLLFEKLNNGAHSGVTVIKVSIFMNLFHLKKSNNSIEYRLFQLKIRNVPLDPGRENLKQIGS